MTAEPITRTDFQNLKALPVGQEVEDEVAEVLDKLEAGGRLYQFRPSPRCTICRDPDLKKNVNKLLGAAFTYQDIADTLGPRFNREGDRHLSYNIIYNHAKEHFPTDETGKVVFRAIQERNAQRYGQDFVAGVGTVVNALTYLETMQVKGYETLVQNEYIVDPVVGMQAAVKLHELLSQSKGEEEIAELRHQLGIIVDAVKEIVPPQYYNQIQQKLMESTGVMEAYVETEEYDEEAEEETSGEVDPEDELHS